METPASDWLDRIYPNGLMVTHEGGVPIRLDAEGAVTHWLSQTEFLGDFGRGTEWWRIVTRLSDTVVIGWPQGASFPRSQDVS